MGFLTGLFGGGEAEEAAKTLEGGYGASIDTFREAENRARGYQQPYMQLGNTAVNLLSDLYSGDYSGFEESPDYKFAREQGQRAVDASGAARRMNLSGAQLKGLQRFGQGLASQQYGNYFSRLYGLAGMGQGAANTAGNYAMNTASNVGNAQVGGANARASGYLAKGNIKNYLASSLHESGQRIGEAWATMGMGGMGGGGVSGANSNLDSLMSTSNLW